MKTIEVYKTKDILTLKINGALFGIQTSERLRVQWVTDVDSTGDAA
jgi:hypothetical protein